jgi:hypothetical protein
MDIYDISLNPVIDNVVSNVYWVLLRAANFKLGHYYFGRCFDSAAGRGLWCEE